MKSMTEQRRWKIWAEERRDEVELSKTGRSKSSHKTHLPARVELFSCTFRDEDVHQLARKDIRCVGHPRHEKIEVFIRPDRLGLVASKERGSLSVRDLARAKRELDSRDLPTP